MERSNEALMMHGTTSALYPAIASLDVAGAMMDGPQGEWLVNEAVTEAIRFRQAVVRTGRRIVQAGDRPPPASATTRHGRGDRCSMTICCCP
ncbi:hypothetical protein [Streptomyces sp. Wb2n-11]|uniref:hypothetical protein n=1 Tax=Streptomyces sp. Wb2n-11 TaxID=1030533 RepID=UPI0021003FF7|nr:hypothetical protein [Streptomyces sp. Wb2n-11]